AVIFGERTLTYAALDAHANRLARHLQGMGVGPDVLVGVCAVRSLELVVGLLAVLKAGGAYVPLDPEYPPDRLREMVEDARLGVVLTQGFWRERLPRSGSRAANGAACVLLEDWLSAASETAGLPEAAEGFVAAAAARMPAVTAPSLSGLQGSHLAYMI